MRRKVTRANCPDECWHCREHSTELCGATSSRAAPTRLRDSRQPGPRVLQGTAVLRVLTAALPSPAPSPLQTPWFPLPFPPYQPTESFINLRKRESKQKESSAEPKRDLNNLPILSSLRPRYYLSACAESPPSGPHQSLPEAPPQPVLLSPALSLLLPALLPLVGDARAGPSACRGDVGTAAAPAPRGTAVLEEAARHSSAGAGAQRSTICCLKYRPVWPTARQ